MMDNINAGLPVGLWSDDASPGWMNKGDNDWQLTASTLVGLQSVPGLVVLYGSTIKKKWAVNSAFMALYVFAAVLVCWILWAYQLSFGSHMIAIWGKPSQATTNGCSVPLWITLAYTVGAYTIWGSGFLKHHIIDYAGGYAIHLSSGVAGFTAAYWVI